MPSAQPKTHDEPSRQGRVAGHGTRQHASATADATRPPRHALLVPACLVAGLSLLVFLPVLGHRFLEGDDQSAIEANPRLNPPTTEGLAQYWTDMRPHREFYVPVNYTAWWLLAKVASRLDLAKGAVVLRPLPFHAVNWIVHALNGVVVLLVLYRLVRHKWAASVGAVLFVLHPVQAEPVSWASSMYSSLSGLFSIVALWQYLRFSDARRTVLVEPSGPGTSAPQSSTRRRDAWAAYGLATVAFAAAVLTKPTAVVTPLMAASIEVLLRGRRLREVVPPLAVWLALVAPVVLLARVSQHGAPVYVPSLPWRVLVALDALAFYLSKLVLPVQLAPDYGRSPHWLLNESGQAYFTWVVPVLLLAAAWVVRRRAGWALACVVLFVAALLPSLGFVPFDYQRYSTVADRYLYLAMLAPALALACVLARHPRPWLFATAAALTAALGAHAAVQATRWRDSDTLFAHTLRVNPRSLAANSVAGYQFARAGRAAEALAAYDRALAANPGDPLVLSLVGDLYIRQRKLPEAVAAYRRALAGMPDDPSLHINLGVALAQTGQVDEGSRLLRRAVELDPRNAEAHANLATALSAKQDLAGARRHYEAALRINPESITARRGIERLGAAGH